MTASFSILSDVSDRAVWVDHIFIGLVVLSGLIIALVFGLLITFSSRYRRGSPAKRGALPLMLRHEIEIGWTAATLFLFLFIFWWAASSQLSALSPPENALQIHIVAKQWMWKAQQPDGIREINEIHAPIDRQVRLIMTSQDVIHSLFLPALRIKQDVLPGRYTNLWFTARKPGVYHLFCAELCGAEHSHMTGRLVLMRPADYARWRNARPPQESLAVAGEKLFRSLGCSGCHGASAKVHAPSLHGLYGGKVHLSDGRVVEADEAYLRDSILKPRSAIVAGYQPIMPSFKGAVSEDQLVRLIAYLESLSTSQPTRQEGPTP